MTVTSSECYLRQNKTMHRNLCTPFILFLIMLFNIAFLVKIWSDSSKLEESTAVELDVIKFNNYLVQFNKSYFGNEYKRRLQNFKASLIEIARLNALEEDTVFGLTQFSDMAAEEFAEKMLMRVHEKTCRILNFTHCKTPNMRGEFLSPAPRSDWNDMAVPDKFDWREHGYVSPVIDQRKCSACWAITVIELMETMGAKENLTHGPLSVQELLDCSEYNKNCLGGNVAKAFEYICKGLGIVSEDDYPLTLKNRSCGVSLGAPGLTLKSFRYHCNVSEDKILSMIANHGPVTTVVNSANWVNYVGGIIRRACVRNNASRYHAVPIIGYDKTAAIPHYIVKNSWGPLFGIDGYVKVAMYGNICGIAEEIGEIDVKKQ